MTNRRLLLPPLTTYLTSLTSFLLDNNKQVSLIFQRKLVMYLDILFPSFAFSKFRATTRIPIPRPRFWKRLLTKPPPLFLLSLLPLVDQRTAQRPKAKVVVVVVVVSQNGPRRDIVLRVCTGARAKSRGKAREIGMRRKRGFPPVSRARAHVRGTHHTLAFPRRSTATPFGSVVRQISRSYGNTMVDDVESGGSC